MELPRPWTVISSDVINSSPGGYPRHSELAIAAENIFSKVEKTCPHGGRWIHRERGDGELTLVHADVPVAWLLATFLEQVRVEVNDYNRNKNGESKLRLRIGIDFGDVQIDALGIPRGGDAIIHAVRLRDCEAAREASRAVPEAPVVAVVSDAVYQRVVPHQALGLQPQMFRRVRALVSEKRFEAVAWLHLPGHPPPWVSSAAQEPGPAGADQHRHDEAPSADLRPGPAEQMPPQRPHPPRSDLGRVHDGRHSGNDIGQIIKGDGGIAINYGGIGNGRGSA